MTGREAKWGTRCAVHQALRTGRPRDARIDALAREAADRTVRDSWFWWVMRALSRRYLNSEPRSLH